MSRDRGRPENVPVAVHGSLQAAPVEALEGLRGPVTVVRRCAGLAELLAACQSGLARAALIAGDSEGVDDAVVDRLAALGAVLLVLSDEEGERARLRRLGVRTAEPGLAGTELAELLSEAPTERTAGLDAALGDPGWLPAGGDPARDSDEGQGAAAGGFSSEPEAVGDSSGNTGEGVRRGRIIVVWGPAGAPGRSVVAVNCAAELAVGGAEVILVDADSYAPSIGVILGLLDESAGLAQACRRAAQGQLDGQGLRGLLQRVDLPGGRLGVLTGVTRADRWPELRAASLGSVLDLCTGLAETVVVDVGFCLEADEELSFDTIAPRRNQATLRAIELADRLLAVGSADAVGVPRLIRALSELGQAVPHAIPEIVFNKVRPTSLGRYPERRLREAWERFGPTLPISATISFAPAVMDVALLEGAVLAESAPESGVRHEIASLVCAQGQQNRKSAVKRNKAGGRLAR